MEIEKLNKHTVSANSTVVLAFDQLQNLLNVLRQKEIPDATITKINTQVNDLNSVSLTGNTLRRQIKKKQIAITRILEKDLKIVPINYYRNLWILLGMTAFGLPMGVAIGLSAGNIGLLGVGFPFGMGVGALIGMRLDKKAKAEGRQLAIELR